MLQACGRGGAWTRAERAGAAGGPPAELPILLEPRRQAAEGLDVAGGVHAKRKQRECREKRRELEWR